MKLRLIQWNIRYDEEPLAVLGALREFSADICCLQEVTTGLSGDIAQMLGQALNMHVVFQPAHHWPPGHSPISIGNCILSRLPLISTTSTLLGPPLPTTLDPGEEDRGYLEATVACGNAHLTVGTAHLSYVARSPSSRSRAQTEAKNLLSILEKKQEQYVLCADLNAQPHATLVRRIRQRLRHAGPAFALPTWPTRPVALPGFSASKPRQRLDYVFVTRDIKVHASSALDTQASDHRPLLVELQVTA